MIRTSKNVILSISGALLLTACSADDPIYDGFETEAGSRAISSTFGEATAQNLEIMTRPEVYTIDLSKKFNDDVTSTVYFDFNSSTLNSDAKSILIRQADWIKQFPEIKFTVYGHTDRVGLSRFNRSLGQRRAQTVVDFLIANGVDKSRLKAVVSEGETNPAVDSRDREPLNRRAITEVSGFVNNYPAAIEGTYAAVIYRDYVESATISTTLETVAEIVTATAGEQ